MPAIVFTLAVYAPALAATLCDDILHQSPKCDPISLLPSDSGDHRRLIFGLDTFSVLPALMRLEGLWDLLYGLMKACWVFSVPLTSVRRQGGA
jgi:hypothetical protein